MLANALFYSGDTSHQLSACKALAERPNNTASSGKNNFGVDPRTLPCQLLLSALTGEHIRGPFTCLVRCQAARSAAVWMLNKGPGRHDAHGQGVWYGLDGLVDWYWTSYRHGVSVVRPIGRVRASKRDAGGAGKGETEWEYVEAELGGPSSQ
jgi:hypothetical protein